jgi:DNA-binding NtrC family response regulator
MSDQPRVTIVDDEPLLLEGMQAALRKKGYVVDSYHDGRSALRSLDDNATDVLITDLKMPEMNGLELLKEARAVDPELVVIVMTAYSTVATAVDAMRSGAYDYVQKPFEIEELDVVMQRALDERRLRRQSEYLSRIQEGELSGRDLIGNSAAINRVKALIDKVADSDTTVLIQGESGTGKELVARYVHHQSSRSDKLLVPVNVAAISDSLLESELFGHTKGAFTGATQARKGLFEGADGGTLLLDEISETSLPVQAKLLRAIEEKEIRPVGSSHPLHVDVRLIASTNVDLAAVVTEGRFREDLYYRLNVFPITVPPLRERKEDIPLIADYFVKQAARRLHKRIASIDNDALDALFGYDWPGNVRELENVLQRAAIVTEASTISKANLLIAQEGGGTGESSVLRGLLRLPLQDARAAFEKMYVQTRMKQASTVSALAEELGVHRTTLYELLRRHEIRADEIGGRSAGGAVGRATPKPQTNRPATDQELFGNTAR